MLSTLDAGPVIIVTYGSGGGGAPTRLQAARPAAQADPSVSPADAVAGGAVERLGGARHVDAHSCSKAGATLHRAFWDAGLVDRVQIFMTPHVLGAGGVAWLPAVALAAGLSERRSTPVGADTSDRGRMFTGLIEAIGEVAEVEADAGGFRHAA